MALTRDFFADPEAFLKTYLVDNVVVQRKPSSGTLFQALNQAKKVYFRMQLISTTTLGLGENRVELVLGETSAAAGHDGDDFAVAAYWCPFLGGKEAVGWVDVPRQNPEYRFVLTAAMQGCWFVVTETVPANPGMMRVHHHQHPAEAALWQKMTPPTHLPSHVNAPQGSSAPLRTMEYSVYGAEEKGAATSANAFNVLHHKDGAWRFLSQAQLLTPQPKGFKATRNRAFPIHTSQAQP
jgi:hypothetical protein